MHSIEAKWTEADTQFFREAAPKGFEPAVQALKNKTGVSNPWAVAWSMKGKVVKPKKGKNGKQVALPAKKKGMTGRNAYQACKY